MALFNRNKKIENPPAKEERADHSSLSLLFNNMTSYSESKALKLSAFYCGVNVLSNSVAMMGKNIVKYDDDESEQIYHPVWKLLNLKPNEKYTSFNFWKDVVSHIILTGAAYAIVDRDDNLNVKRILPIETDFVQPMLQNDGSVKYLVQGIGTVEGSDMLDFAMYRDEMWYPISLLKYAANTLKNASDAENTSAKFYKSGSLNGVLTASSTLNSDQKAQIRTSWREAFSADGSGVAVLPNGLTYQPVSVDPQTAQLLDTRSFGIDEIARFLNVSPIKLYKLEEVSYNSLEATNLYFIQDSVRPYCELIANELNLKLFKPSEVGKIGVKFDYSSALSANKESEIAYYRGLLTNGLATPNEIRKKLGFPAIPADEGGDSLLVQISYGTLKDIAQGKYIKQKEQSQTVDNQAKIEN